MAGCLILIQCQHPPSSGAASPPPTQTYTLSLQAVVEYHIGESERVCEFILVESVAPQTTQLFTLAYSPNMYCTGTEYQIGESESADGDLKIRK